jgi:uncharacterized protein
MTKFKTALFYFLTISVFISIGWFANTLYHLPKSSNNPISQVKPRPLEKYSIENLADTQFKEGNIEIGEVIKEDEDFTSHKFSFEFSPDLSKNTKSTTGLINIPSGVGPFPILIMFRGYVDQEIYQTGVGTKNSGEFFARNGFITISPDFLGYAESSEESVNIFESRFQTYVTALNLLSSVKSIKDWDGKNIFIWGHSNGGQVALTILEESGVDYPTVLWAPVTKPFPYSILYYTDDSIDHGKLIRRELSKFEEDYDVEKYSLTNYLDRIKAPIQLHQGTLDDAVPVAWSDSIVKNLEKLNIEVDYIKHFGSDHNMQPDWNIAINQSLSFYLKNLTR